MTKALRADLCLLAMTVIWGATFPLITAALPFISSFLFVSLRFVLAALFLLPWIFKQFSNTTARLLIAGFILGILNAMIYGFQTYGMCVTDADTSAFISSIGVVIVPFISPFFRLSKVKGVEVLSAVICLFGLFVLTGASLSQLQIGEGWIALSSLSWALAICYLQKVTQKLKSTALLAFYQILFTIPLSSLGIVASTPVLKFNILVIVALLYCSLFATSIVFLIQTRYQRDTSASHAAIIYSLEPVFASLFALVITHEALTSRILIGGGLILISVLAIELLPLMRMMQ